MAAVAFAGRCPPRLLPEDDKHAHVGRASHLADFSPIICRNCHNATILHTFTHGCGVAFAGCFAPQRERENRRPRRVESDAEIAEAHQNSRPCKLMWSKYKRDVKDATVTKTHIDAFGAVVKVELIANTTRRDHEPKIRDVSSERQGKSKTSETQDVGSTRDAVPPTGETHRNVLVKSCGIGWSHRTPVFRLPPRNSQASKSAENVGTRPFQRAPRRTSRGLSHFRSGVTIARKVWDDPEPIVTRGPPLAKTRTCVSPHVCVCPWSGRPWQGCASSAHVARRPMVNSRTLERRDRHCFLCTSE